MKVTRVRRRTYNRREWGCPLTKNRSPWCFQMCCPTEGVGECGRIAPHALFGRTRAAILARKLAHGAAA